MADFDPNPVLGALRDEETALVEAIRKAEIKLAKVQAACAAMEALATDEPATFEGKLADACREVLRRAAGKSLTPIEVRDQLKVIGYDISSHTNVMASVHSVLKRLAESQKDIKSKDTKDGTKYFWAGEARQSGRSGSTDLSSAFSFSPAMSEMLDALANQKSSMSKALEDLRVPKVFDSGIAKQLSEMSTPMQEALKSLGGPLATTEIGKLTKKK